MLVPRRLGLAPLRLWRPIPVVRSSLVRHVPQDGEAGRRRRAPVVDRTADRAGGGAGPDEAAVVGVVGLVVGAPDRVDDRRRQPEVGPQPPPALLGVAVGVAPPRALAAERPVR